MRNVQTAFEIHPDSVESSLCLKIFPPAGKVCPPRIRIHLTILTAVCQQPHERAAFISPRIANNLSSRRCLVNNDGNLPLVDPTLVLLHEFGASFLERDVWSQLLDRERLPRERIRRAPLQMLDDGCALV